MCSQNVHLFIFWITQKLTDFNSFWYAKSWENFTWKHLTDSSTSPVRCSHPKSHFSTLLFIYFKLFTLPPEENNSSCCSAALAAYLLLFSASYYLHRRTTSGHATGGAHVYWYGRAEVCGSGLLQHGLNFSTAWCSMRPNSVEKDWKHVAY